MAHAAIAAREALRPMPDLRGVRLADVEGSKGAFTGRTVDYRSPCTVGERRTCRIVSQLSEWNDLLSEAYLELRKEPSSPVGFLSLVTLDQSFPSAAEDHKLHRCATLVYWLLKTHRCVVSVDVNLRNLGAYYMLLFVALRGNPAVKTLKVGLWTYWGDHQDPRSIASCLENIEEIECRLFPDWPSQILSTLTTLLRTSSSLTSIKIPKLPLRNHDASALLEALVTNGALKKMSMRSSDLTMAWINHRHKFWRLLVGGGCSLNMFSVSDLVEMRKDVFKWILNCLRENRTITHALLQRVVVDEEIAAVVTGILVENPVLRCFNMSEMRTDSEFRRENFLLSWLPALAGNETLEEFTLPMSACKGQLWMDFLAVLPTKRVMKKITIEITHDDYHTMPSMYQALANAPEAGRLVFFKRLNPLSSADTVWNEPSQWHAWLFHNTRNVFTEIMRQLPSLDHLTIAHFRVSADLLDHTTSSAMSSYIRTTRSLKKLCIACFSLDAGAENAASFWSDVIESIAVNATLMTLAVKPRYITARAIRCLANVLKSSHNIHTVHVNFEESADTDFFVQTLSPGLTETNSCLIALAAEFVGGFRCDRYCAGALERMHDPRRAARAGRPALVRYLTAWTTTVGGRVRRFLRLCDVRDPVPAQSSS
ncbi:hypothetical protein MRX96_005843 [Rhipicephalus microplus]